MGCTFLHKMVLHCATWILGVCGLRGGPVRNGGVLGVELMIPIQFTQSGSILISPQDWVSLGVSVVKRVSCPKDI